VTLNTNSAFFLPLAQDSGSPTGTTVDSVGTNQAPDNGGTVAVDPSDPTQVDYLPASTGTEQFDYVTSDDLTQSALVTVTVIAAPTASDFSTPVTLNAQNDPINVFVTSRVQ
jgi:hypothetical protein